ncbi:MAG TPA: hypothetical protein VFV53_10235 [Candidatus Limnocylindrales bacterium]|nr:hypothetical protein [Candidatus Limnocylindrales bacterium]
MIGPALAGRLAVLALATVLVGGCGDAATPTDPASTGPTFTGSSGDPTTPTPASTPDIGAVLRGDWRRVPFDPRGEATVVRLEAACHAAEPAIEGLPVALVDARGRGRLLLVYATDPTSAAFECRAGVDFASVGDVVVRRLQASGEPIAEDAIDVLEYETAELGGEVATVAVGRVGALAAKVIASLFDETVVYGSRGGGWWAMWWPGTTPVGGIGATDTHNLVIGTVVPELP